MALALRGAAKPGRSALSVVPAQRRVGIELVDMETKLAHLVSRDELVAGHQRGDYVGFCGTRFVAASLVEPGHGPCQPCQQRAATP
jgi:hypothetical protein